MCVLKLANCIFRVILEIVRVEYKGPVGDVYKVIVIDLCFRRGHIGFYTLGIVILLSYF